MRSADFSYDAAMTRTHRPLFLAALVAGTGYYANHWIELDGLPGAAWKGSGVGLLALWAATQARSLDGWLLAAALTLGTAGDMLLTTHGLTVGAVAFFAGHCVATGLYLRHRARPWWIAAAVALALPALSWWLPADRGEAPGLAFYALGLGAMAGTALASRFALAGLGAALFVVSDLLIFARLGPLAHSPLPGLLVWPTYFAGQALIAWGVATGLRGEAPAEAGGWSQKLRRL